MDLWHSLGGMVALTLTSADPSAALTAFNSAGIVLHNVQKDEDDLRVRFFIRRQDYKKLCGIVKRRGDTLGPVKRNGLYWIGKGLLRRPVLLCGIVLLLFLVLFLPTRIFFFRVEGNVTVPTKLILEKCAQYGIAFGTSRKEVRSERLKNAILEAIPELQWAGINTSGCTATISVRERSIPDETEKEHGVSSIAASRDGIITECTVIRGSAACQIGQAVRAGQVLISGYTDCGISIRAEQAEGEVYAQTQHELTAKMPSEFTERVGNSTEIIKYSLIIGKKRINLYKGSGISDASCVKMYSENYITLPGGFQLPVAIVTEVWTYFDEEISVLSEEQATVVLSDFVKHYLPGQMVAGQILDKQESILPAEGVFCLEGKYACLEMIGVMRSEEIMKPYGEHD